MEENIEIKTKNMNSNFKIRITIISLFLIYASCTAIMVRMNLIPLNMLAVEILESIVIFILIMVFFYKIDSLEKRNNK